MQLNHQLRSIQIGLLFALGALPCLVALPAAALWPFHHQTETQQQNSSDNLPPQMAHEQSFLIRPELHGGRRLLPFSASKNATNKAIQPKPTPVTQAVEKAKEGSLRSNSIGQNSAIDKLPANNLMPSLSEAKAHDTNLIPLNTISTYTTTNIRIAVGLDLKTAKLAVLDGAQLVDTISGQVLANLPAQSEWQLTAKDNVLVLQPAKAFYYSVHQLVKLYDSNTSNFVKPVNFSSSASSQPLNDQTIGSFLNRNSKTLPLINQSKYSIKPAVNKDGQQGLLAINDRVYRGVFVISQASSKNKDSLIEAALPSFNIINSLNLEDYLKSVVPSEMPSLWPSEALKAQAIAARSYAIANLGKHGSAGYDLKDNTEDQVYLGVKSESEQTNMAVNATKGLVLKYNGKPICAYFHSSSGGSTEGAENVWQSPLPYLKAVADFDQECPLYNWTKNYTISQTESGLPKDIGQILSINVLAKGPSGRATYMLINGSNGSRIITGEAARKYFSLPSTNFNVTPAETSYIFAGKGFGHGLGLSQWGAKSLAKHGYNAAQILCYYYNDISIDY